MFLRLPDFPARCWAPLRASRWVWWWFRQVSGDAAYENYLRSVLALPSRGLGSRPAQAVLSREEFFLDVLRRRYSGVSRCC